MRLFIAEKPSLGRAIAAALPKPHKNEQGYIQCGNGDVVTWCIGHLLEQVEPDVYDPRYKKWNMADLPIIPEKWQLRPRAAASKQLTVIRKLFKSKPELINAGDPDREGQLLVDEVIDYLKATKAQKQATQRLLISDLNLSAVKRAISQMRSNQDFIPLSASALARSRADWLYGMNMSRANTIQGQKAGYQGVLSVGRVQTPVLGLVVRRDQEIKHFVSKDYFTLDALIPYKDGDEQFDIKARWQPSEAIKPWQDEEGRVLSQKLVENVASRIRNQDATVTKAVQKLTKQYAPLPYSLSALQIDAAKRYNLSAQAVLDTCQTLYEKHKLITYPRSDSRYLPNEHFAQAQKVSQAIAHNDPSLVSAVQGADLSIKSKAWNDNKVDAHHAIIPTPKIPATNAMSGNEAKIYTLISRQYLMQFYPEAVYAESSLDFDIAGGLFIAKGRILTAKGWRVLLSNSNNTNTQSNNDESPPVPALKKGEVLICREGEVKLRKTQPPRHFTEVTLLQAMTGIARFVEDKNLKKILRETDGIGTEATRAGILELLFKRQFLVRQGKDILATDVGTQLILALPKVMTLPDMTAHWESQLEAMTKREISYQSFMQPLVTQLNQLLVDVQQSRFNGLQGKGSFKPKMRKRRTKRS